MYKCRRIIDLSCAGFEPSNVKDQNLMLYLLSYTLLVGYILFFNITEKFLKKDQFLFQWKKNFSVGTKIEE